MNFNEKSKKRAMAESTSVPKRAMAALDTQTPNILSLTPSTKSNIMPNSKAWGRLYSTYTPLEAVDLEDETFILGRADSCHLTIDETILSVNIIANISKTHFRITKEEDSLIYITDLSKNGTFVNGKRIGKGNRNILQDDDEISIGFKGLKVYVFKNVSSKENDFLPFELRQKYYVSKRLGQGACGEVKLIFDKVTCRPYAVKKIDKIVNPIKKRSLTDATKIKSELNILQTLKHPFIVSLHEILETDQAVFIVLEYMEGGDLANVILTNSGLKESEVKYLFYQICLSVKYLHDNEVVHRDLKPDNILLKSVAHNSLIKLSDFGLSKIIDEQTFMKTICGTPLYVAPEVLDKAVYYYDKQVDIWSLGVILFYMLGQELPFRDTEKKIPKEQILKADYNFTAEKFKDVSEMAKDLISHMLVVNPMDRFTIDAVISHPWLANDAKMVESVLKLVYENTETATLESSCDSDTTTSPPSKKSRLS